MPQHRPGARPKPGRPANPGMTDMEFSMRGLNVTDGRRVACGVSAIEIHNINPPPKIGVIANPTLPPAPVLVNPPPHTEPVFPPPAVQ